MEPSPVGLHSIFSSENLLTQVAISWFLVEAQLLVSFEVSKS